MAIKEKERIFTINAFKEPVVLENENAIAMLLMRLILLEPGSDPLHPDMGVGIQNYRYAMGRLDELKERVQEQISTFLPCFPASEVSIEITDDHLCNIKIEINNTVYMYDSAQAPIPITLESAKASQFY